MVQFPPEDIDDPLTTGRGTFLTSETDQYSLGDTLLCTGFKVDSPLHDTTYFKNQIKAIRNYYHSVSNGSVNFNYSVLKTTYEVTLPMRDYAVNDQKLGEFFTESIELAKSDIDSLGLNMDEVLLVVFHAGMGQDFSVPFIDPTSHDLKSAYVDDEMLEEIESSRLTTTLGIINRGIILPETQNMIYYDVVQDIFSETDDLCDIQVGLTGTFALLMGYALGLPPLFNTETGMSGVGVFGLMDHGSNNGRGVIPAPPTAWTRINQGWADSTIIRESGNFTITSRYQSEQIFRIDISSKEYFLIENRNNWISENADIDSLRRKEEYRISDQQLGHWFDTVLSELSESQFDTLGGVFTNFDNYDYGLPGSGLLIWHIREPQEDLLSGINNDRDNQAIQLEEADGAVDIGYSSSHPLFTQHVNGWKFDLWYADNFYYFEYGNPEESIVIFDKDTRPNTDATDGARSGIRIKVISEPSDEMTFSVELGVDSNYEIELLPEDEITILGNGQIDGIGNIFYAYGDKIYQKNSVIETEFPNLGFDNTVLCYENICEAIVDSSKVDSSTVAFTFLNQSGDSTVAHEFIVFGKLTSITETEPLSKKASLGDIDGDGLDELVSIPNGSIVVENYPNYTDVNGFPVIGDFKGQPLIADIIDVGDSHPEIICREGNHITILSHKGERLKEIAAFSNQQIAIVPNWRDGKAALIDGAQLLVFDFDADNSYWLNEFSQPSNFPESTGVHEVQPSFEFTNGLMAYNYPNPVRDEGTRFRFFVGNESSASVKIYDVMGLHVVTLESNQIWVQNEFNEIEWMPSSDVQAGLYFAEVSLDSGESELVKVVVIR